MEPAVSACSASRVRRRREWMASRNGTVGRVKTQVLRLFTSAIYVEWDDEEKKEIVGPLGIGAGIRLWRADKFDGRLLIPSSVELGEEFADWARRSPYPSACAPSTLCGRRSPSTSTCGSPGRQRPCASRCLSPGTCSAARWLAGVHWPLPCWETSQPAHAELSEQYLEPRNL